MKQILKSQQNRLSLPMKNQNQTTKPSKYMTKANKTVLIIFVHAYIRIVRPPPSLKRDVINEWPLIRTENYQGTQKIHVSGEVVFCVVFR